GVEHLDAVREQANHRLVGTALLQVLDAQPVAGGESTDTIGRRRSAREDGRESKTATPCLHRFRCGLERVVSTQGLTLRPVSLRPRLCNEDRWIVLPRRSAPSFFHFTSGRPVLHRAWR